MKSNLGTIYFKAPEVLKQSYDFKWDVWSAGVTLYIMLTGLLPFSGDDDEETNQSISTINYDFCCEEFNNISEEAKDLLSKIFIQESSRLTAK